MSEESNAKRVCPSCGAAVPPEAPEGLCPACVLNEAAGAERDKLEAATLPDRLVAPPLEKVAAAFPGFKIIELIGCGGMAAVYKARQPKLDRLVALKILPSSFGADAGFNERFEREGRVLAKLSHPNIVGVYDFGESGGFHYLVMEYVEGVNLRQAMRAGRFTPQQALAVVPEICAALQFAHEEGVLHRDIKPENILLDAKGRVKIADFGIAKIVGDAARMEATLTGTGSLGTPQYMAPEQIETPREVDHRADIYSLGVVFYEMLTGELPMGRFAAPSERSEVGVRVDEIVMRALAKERELRQQSAEEVRTEVEGVTHSSVASGDLRRAGEAKETVGGGAAVENPWPRRVFWLLAALAAVPVLWAVVVFVVGLVVALVRALSGEEGPGGAVPGAPEILIILLIGGIGLAVLLAAALGIAHLLGWRRHAPARAAAGGGGTNPWPRRTFWLLLAVVVVPFVLVLVVPMVLGLVVGLWQRAANADARAEEQRAPATPPAIEANASGQVATEADSIEAVPKMVGTWTVDEQAGTRVGFAADGTFAETRESAGGKTTLSGNWGAEGHLFIVIVKESSDPGLIGSARRDEIVTVEEDRFVLRKPSDGKLLTYRRAGKAKRPTER